MIADVFGRARFVRISDSMVSVLEDMLEEGGGLQEQC
jgi:hypothetical protein